MNMFGGTGVALVTPFDESGRIDEVSLKGLVDYVIEGGVDYLVALGTTSEAATMSAEERGKVLSVILEQNRERVPVMVGIGGNNTEEVCRNLKEFPVARCQAILSVTPYYNKPSQEGLYQHFKKVSETASLPVFLYNVPGRTGVNMNAATTVRLSLDCPNVIGVKEASGNFAQAADILNGKRAGFQVVSGDDALALPLMAVGMEGVISVAANVCPAELSQMINQVRKQHYKEAREIHLRLSDLFQALFAEGNPAGIKAALHARGVIRHNVLRLPLTPVSAGLYNTIKSLLA